MTRRTHKSPAGHVFRLLFCSAILSTLLYWMNPHWFDSHVAFWRPRPYENEVALVTDAQSRAQAAAQDVLAPPPRRGTYTSDGIRLFDQRIVEGDYDPARGLTLETMEGARLEFPPGSIREAAHVRVAPVAEVPPKYLNKDLLVAGPCYKILVGGQESYQFSRPIRTTLPYHGHLLQGDPRQYLAIYVSENGQWHALPTQVDTANQTVTAELPHCSLEVPAIIAAVKTAAAVAAALAGTGAALTRSTATGSGLWNRATRPGDDTYSTANFDIIYTTSGERAVPGTFPLRPATPVAGRPDFVVLIGEHLEAIRPDLGIVGMPLEGRCKVFLEPLSGDAAGESRLGGPMWISTKWNPKGAYPPADELDRWLRATVAHEIIHVAQRRTLWLYSAQKYWVEMSAAYLADLYWEKKGNPTNMVRDFYLPAEDGKLLSRPMDVGEHEHFYAYGVFLRWLEGKGDTVKLTQAVNSTGRGNIDDFDTALRQVMKKPLVDLLGEFALDYYHNDLAKGQITPARQFNNSARTQARRQGIAGDNFAMLIRMLDSGLPSGGQGVLNIAESAKVPDLPPRCALAAIVHVDQLAEYRKAKLVLDITPAGGDTLDGELSLMLASSRTGASLPTGGQLGAFTTAWSQGPLPANAKPRGMHVIEQVMAPRGTDHVTLVLFNRSTTRTLPGPVVTRWALLRPDWVTYQRVDLRSAGAAANFPGEYVSPSWSLSGPDCDLRSVSSPPGLFGGYAIYCRPKGQKDFPKGPYALLRPDQAISGYTATLPDTQDYAWTYAVRDRYGNESEKALSEEQDPFQGTWTGSVSLMQGSLEQLVVQAFASAKKQNAAKYHPRRSALQKELAAATDPARRQSIQSQINDLEKEVQQDKQILDKVDEVVTHAARYTEWLARLGIPVDLQVRAVGGQYSLRVSKVAFRDTGMTDWVPLERKGSHTLAIAQVVDPKTKAPVPLPKGVPPLYLQLHRPDEILDDYMIEVEAEGKPLSYHLRWNFVRTEGSPPGKP